MLSGIMLKMGIYGVIRWMIPNAPLGFLQWQNTWLLLAVIGIVYASLIAFNQKDGKRLGCLLINSTRWLDSRRYICLDNPGCTGRHDTNV
jgi:hypothetical protein